MLSVTNSDKSICCPIGSTGRKVLLMKKAYSLWVGSWEQTIVDEMRISEIEYKHQLKLITQAVEKQIKFNQDISFEFQVCAEHTKNKYEYDKYYAVVDRFELEGAVLRLTKVVAKDGCTINNSYLKRE